MVAYLGASDTPSRSPVSTPAPGSPAVKSRPCDTLCTKVEFHPNGRRMREFRFKRGRGEDSAASDTVRHGVLAEWDSTGRQRLSEPYEEGKLHGIRTEWWPDGRPRAKAYLSKGKRDSAFIWGPDGRLTGKVLPGRGVDTFYDYQSGGVPKKLLLEPID